MLFVLVIWFVNDQVFTAQELDLNFWLRCSVEVYHNPDLLLSV